MSLTAGQLQQLILQYGVTKLRKMEFAPSYPREGLVAYADGVNWNPGNGVGPYIYLNGGWVFLSPGSGSGAPGGLNQQVQFNNGGTFSGLTNIQLTARIQPFTSALLGAVPASGGGTTNFLRADGTFAVPSGATVSDGDKTDITVTGSGAVWTIDNDVVTFAKMQNINTDRLIGRDTTASGDPEELTVGGGLEFTGSLGIQRSALIGDVTAPAGSSTTTIAAGAVQNSMLATGAVTTAKIFDDQVTLAKLQEISQNRLLGRVSVGTGNPEELTGLQAATLLVGGGDKQVQFNDGGVFGGDASLTWDKTALALSVNGRVLVGGAASQTVGSVAPWLQVHGTDNASGSGIIGRWSTGQTGAIFQLFKSRSSVVGTHGAIQTDDILGHIQWLGDDGTSYIAGAYVRVWVDGTIVTGAMPTRMTFHTVPAGSSTDFERMRIDKAGNVIVNTAAIATSATDGFLYIPSCAGVPSGVPTAYTGRIPLVYDSTNNRLYAYNGAWRSTTLT